MCAVARYFVTLRVKFPWWWRIFVGAAEMSARVAMMTGIPISGEHIMALGEYLAAVISKHTKCTIVS